MGFDREACSMQAETPSITVQSRVSRGNDGSYVNRMRSNHLQNPIRAEAPRLCLIFAKNVEIQVRGVTIEAVQLMGFVSRI